jgi:hypothetical protein
VLLPNATDVIIEPSKLRDYLLNEKHPSNRGKARVLYAIGFTKEGWQQLETALRGLVLINQAEFSRETPYGPTYAVTGLLQGPSGAANMKTIWALEDDATRFLSLYPSRQRT